MAQFPFYLVNVFAQGKYSGNQLAVFDQAEGLSDAEMQDIARENRFAETSFICSKEENGDFGVRIFTSKGEVPFAGHPALGTAFVIQRFISPDTAPPINLQFKAGQIPVSGDAKDMLWMEQLTPSFGDEIPVEAVSPLLGLSPAVFDRRYPIQVVSTGLPFIIVPLLHLDAVRQAGLNPIHYYNLIRETQAKALFIFSPETYQSENDLNARVFSDFYGVPEDAASGSANGCLAGYLVRHNFYEKAEIAIRVEQGYEIKRPSLLHLRAETSGDQKIKVQVGGKVTLIAKGEWKA